MTLEELRQALQRKTNTANGSISYRLLSVNDDILRFFTLKDIEPAIFSWLDWVKDILDSKMIIAAFSELTSYKNHLQEMLSDNIPTSTLKTLSNKINSFQNINYLCLVGICNHKRIFLHRSLEYLTSIKIIVDNLLSHSIDSDPILVCKYYIQEYEKLKKRIDNEEKIGFKRLSSESIHKLKKEFCHIDFLLNNIDTGVLANDEIRYRLLNIIYCYLKKCSKNNEPVAILKHISNEINMLNISEFKEDTLDTFLYQAIELTNMDCTQEMFRSSKENIELFTLIKRSKILKHLSNLKDISLNFQNNRLPKYSYLQEIKIQYDFLEQIYSYYKECIDNDLIYDFLLYLLIYDTYPTPSL